MHAHALSFSACYISVSFLKCLALCYGMYPSTFTYNTLQGQCSNVRQFVDTILAPHLHCRPDKQLVQLRGSLHSILQHAVATIVSQRHLLDPESSMIFQQVALPKTWPWSWAKGELHRFSTVLFHGGGFTFVSWRLLGILTSMSWPHWQLLCLYSIKMYKV